MDFPPHSSYEPEPGGPVAGHGVVSVRLPDAKAANWVDRFAPETLRPWLKLGRFDRPVGIWLLFLPGAMGLCATAAASPTLLGLRLLEFLLGAALMRAAGCAFNDWVDRDIDARVERTRDRPMASGRIGSRGAMIFIVICCLISLGSLIQLGPLSIGLGLASLALVAAYPYMKRITWWPQAWLGLTFNWGFPMAVASVLGRVPLWAMVFYLGLVAWTLGYDTIYALQDIEDDAMIGVKSSARALGPLVRTGVAVFYGASAGLTALGAFLAGFGLAGLIGPVLAAIHFAFQVRALNPSSRAGALALFKSNIYVGLIWALGLGIALLLARAGT